MKSHIFITAGHRPAEQEHTVILCLKAMFKILPFSQRVALSECRRSMTCGYESIALAGNAQKHTVYNIIQQYREKVYTFS